jgi:hypothetical protein
MRECSRSRRRMSDFGGERTLTGRACSREMRSMRTGLIAALLLCSGCGATGSTRDQLPPVAALEVPLPTARDRADFTSLLRREATAHGFHVDAATPNEIESSNSVSPISLNATVWRGDDEEVVASAMDGVDHFGRVWISFEPGSDPKSFAAFRTVLWPLLVKQWPEARRLPIMPNGAIPLPQDLLRTPTGYKVKRSAAAIYAR